MSVASEITRLQNAKAALKTAINSKNDSSHQIDDETLEDYAGFVDNISTGSTSTLITKTITENGTYDAEDDDADGYSEVTVNVHEVLPFGYKELEYLESSGTQYIDTDIPLKTNTDDVEVDFYVGSLETTSSIFGARYSTSSRAYSFGVTNNSQWRPSFGSTTENTGTATVGRHVAFMSHNGGILTVDGTQIISIGNASITTPDGCYVFAIKGNGSNKYYSTCRIYSFKIWRSGALVMHLVPAQRLSDLEVGMYDKVSGIFFTNSGTGEFIIPSGQSFSVATKTITTNGVYNASEDNVNGYSQINVNVQSESVQPEVAPQSDVNFYDFDGTIVYSYTASEFAQLTEMPANPTHAGLISQGWNWTLADAKAQVAAVGACDIGQMYVTEDEKTRLYCHIEDELKSFYFGIAPNGTVVIDWGDGSNTDTVTGTSNTTLVNTQHTYSKGGDYVITISVTNGNFSFYSTTSGYHLFCGTTSNVTTSARPYLAFLRKVELGTNARLGQCAFTYCTNLETITIPKTIDSISTRIFEGCYSLRHITFPKRDSTLFTNIPSYFAKYCYSLKSFSIPTGITSLNTQSLYGTCSLYRFILSTTVTTIAASAIYTDYALSKLVLPSGVTSIATKAFYGSYGMREYHFKSTTPPTLDNADAFTSIPSSCVIYVPSASLNSYKTASNWSTYASQMVGE